MLTTCCCGCAAGSAQICAHVKDCGGSDYSGVTVTITGPSGYSSSGTTDGTGHYCTSLSDALPLGAYTVAASDGTYSRSTTVTVGACTSYGAELCLGGSKVCVQVAGCGPLSGVTVNFRRAGTTVISAVTDGTGTACACVPNGTGAVTATVDSAPTRYTTGGTSTITVAQCSTTNATIVLPAATGYHCLPCSPCTGFVDTQPAPDTLYASGLYGGGSHSMTYGANTTFAPLGWYGSYTVAYPGCKDPGTGITLCPTGTLKVEFAVLPVTTGGVTYCYFKVAYTLLGYDSSIYAYCTILTPPGGADVALNSGSAAITWTSCPPSTVGTVSAPGPEFPPSCTPSPNTTTVTITE